jgi:predicted RNA-binding Zn-ribbon protein involved in translation (DUF1610 family)
MSLVSIRRAPSLRAALVRDPSVTCVGASRIAQNPTTGRADAEVNPIPAHTLRDGGPYTTSCSSCSLMCQAGRLLLSRPASQPRRPLSLVDQASLGLLTHPGQIEYTTARNQLMNKLQDDLGIRFHCPQCGILDISQCSTRKVSDGTRYAIICKECGQEVSTSSPEDRAETGHGHRGRWKRRTRQYIPIHIPAYHLLGLQPPQPQRPPLSPHPLSRLGRPRLTPEMIVGLFLILLAAFLASLHLL